MDQALQDRENAVKELEESVEAVNKELEKTKLEKEELCKCAWI